VLELVPRRAFLRFEIPLHSISKSPRIDASLRKWTPHHLLPPLEEIDGRPVWADVYAAWNDDGLFFAFDVRQRRGPPECDVEHWWKGDGLRICIDTRDTRENKRATRFCHFFYVLPTGGGANRRGPVVGVHKMSRSKEPAPVVDLSRIKVAVAAERTHYCVEAFFPGDVLNGWSPAEHPRIGLFYKIKDTYRDEQTLTGGDDLGWNADPSVWATAVLTPGDA
jgi:hypothetical protein